jgi:uncharacterized protein (DUF1697 family)
VSTHVALLRGINVGTAKRVAMAELRAMAERLGYADVATHLNSGNLLLSTGQDAETLRSRLEHGIEQTFGLHSDVVVRTADQLAAALAANPFPDGDPSRVAIAFLAEPAPAGAEQRLAALAAEDEPFLVQGLEAYVHHVHGQADSKLAAGLVKALGVTGTVRNLRTVTKVVELCQRSNMRGSAVD